MKKLILVAGDYEYQTLAETMKALSNVLITQYIGRKKPVDLTKPLNRYLPCVGLNKLNVDYEPQQALIVGLSNANYFKKCGLPPNLFLSILDRKEDIEGF